MTNIEQVVWDAYEKSLDPNASVTERNAAIQLCDEFKENYEICVPLALQWASKSTDPKASFFGLHCLETVLKQSWHKMAKEFQQALKDSLINLLKIKNPHSYLSIILSKCLSYVIQYEWPHNWPNMLEQLSDSGEVSALRIFLEEVFIFETIPVNKRRELSQHVQKLLVPSLLPELLQLLAMDSCTVDQTLVVLSVLFPIIHVCPDGQSILQALSKHIVNTDTAGKAIECIIKVMSVNKKSQLSPLKILLPDVIKMYSQKEDMHERGLLDSVGSLINSLYNFDKSEFKSISDLWTIVIGLALDMDFALSCNDSYFDCIVMICDFIHDIEDLYLSGIMDMCLDLSVQQASESDLEESRKLARTRVVCQKLANSAFLLKPDIYNRQLNEKMFNQMWPKVCLLLTAVNISDVDFSQIYTMFNTEPNKLIPSTQFIELTFKYIREENLQTYMIQCLLEGAEPIQDRANVILHLARDSISRTILQKYIGKLVECLSNISDCLSVSLIAEAILLIVKGDANAEEQALNMLLEPCNFIVQYNESIFENYEKREISTAMHLLASIARSIADTHSGKSKLSQFIPSMYKIACISKIDSVAVKAIEFLGACLSNEEQIFCPDKQFAVAILETDRYIVLRSVLRQFTHTVIEKCTDASIDYLQTLLVTLPLTVDRIQNQIPHDLTPEQDSSEREKVAFITRDAVEVFRKICLNDSLFAKFDIKPIIEMAFSLLCVIFDSFSVKRMIPVCLSMINNLEDDSQLSALICSLRSLKVFAFKDKEGIGHELFILSSKIFDILVNRLGVDSMLELYQSQIGQLERSELLTYINATTNNINLPQLSDKKRKKLAETLFKNILKT